MPLHLLELVRRVTGVFKCLNISYRTKRLPQATQFFQVSLWKHYWLQPLQSVQSEHTNSYTYISKKSVTINLNKTEFQRKGSKSSISLCSSSYSSSSLHSISSSTTFTSSSICSPLNVNSFTSGPSFSLQRSSCGSSPAG